MHVPEADIKYYLDLGQVYFTAEVRVNEQDVGKLIWAPYQLEVTDLLKSGYNTLSITVTPARRNEFVGEALKGNKKFIQFTGYGQENSLIPSGLVGPVTISSR